MFDWTWGDTGTTDTDKLANDTLPHTFASAEAYAVHVCAKNTTDTIVCSVHVLMVGGAITPVSLAHPSLVTLTTQVTYTVNDNTSAGKYM